MRLEERCEICGENLVWAEEPNTGENRDGCPNCEGLSKTNNIKVAPVLAERCIFDKQAFIFKGKKIERVCVSRVKNIFGCRLNGWLFLEQNPATSSQWAKIARSGGRVMWIIKERTNEYVGRMVNGKIERLSAANRYK